MWTKHPEWEDGRQRCVKCGSRKDPLVKFVEESRLESSGAAIDTYVKTGVEYLRVTCADCGYTTTRPCDDAA